MPSPKILTIDCETSPNIASVWGLRNVNIAINQVIETGRVICVGAKWLHQKKPIFLAEWDKDGHLGMIKALHELLAEADMVVHYNGDSFDMKWFNTEFWLAGLSAPAPVSSIDLLKTTRKKFYLPSRKLDFVGQAKGIGAKVENGGMSLWNDVLRGHSDVQAKARLRMQAYCLGDVKLTEKLYLDLLPWIDNHPNVSLYVEDDEPCCPNCGSDSIQRRGWAYTTSLRYRRFQCQACLRWLRSKNSEKSAELRPL